MGCGGTSEVGGEAGGEANVGGVGGGAGAAVGVAGKAEEVGDVAGATVVDHTVGFQFLRASTMPARCFSVRFAAAKRRSVFWASVRYIAIPLSRQWDQLNLVPVLVDVR